VSWTNATLQLCLSDARFRSGESRSAFFAVWEFVVKRDRPRCVDVLGHIDIDLPTAFWAIYEDHDEPNRSNRQIYIGLDHDQAHLG